MDHVFVIDIGKAEEEVYIVKNVTLEDATQRVHRLLVTKYPKLFTNNWKDLLADIVEFGSQCCYSTARIQELS